MEARAALSRPGITSLPSSQSPVKMDIAAVPPVSGPPPPTVPSGCCMLTPLYFPIWTSRCTKILPSLDNWSFYQVAQSYCLLDFVDRKDTGWLFHVNQTFTWLILESLKFWTFPILALFVTLPIHLFLFADKMMVAKFGQCSSTFFCHRLILLHLENRNLGCLLRALLVM